MTENTSQRCGFAAIIGAPNAGKSTLVNQLVGAKVSIVTHKVQTTRTRVLGIGVFDGAQVAFVDTPGIFAPKRRLDRAMVHAAWQGAEEADALILLIDAEAGVTKDVDSILKRLEETSRSKTILALNKIDVVKRETLLTLTERLHSTGLFDEVLMISALSGDGVEDLARAVAARMPESPWLFPEDQLSDMPEMLLAAEITREKLFLNVHEELPYIATVETEAWERFKNGDIRLEQTIYVERDSQKAIVLGKGGQRVKRIGAQARTELAELFETPVHLFLFVKVRDRWQNDPERYRIWNLDFSA